MSDPPPAKRQRSADEQEIIRSSEIWHRDGSVVLQASGTQFRVHWSVLAAHSSFFRDLEGLPQPLDEPKVEGCPIVELSDSAEDVEAVLKALYDPWFFTQKPLPLSVMASHIRLGRKYEMKDVLRTMVERLEFEHPRTESAYETLRKAWFTYRPVWYDSYRGYLFDVVTLARENRILAVLPCAYLRVALHHTPGEILDGVKRPDRTLAKLSSSDQRLCIIAQTEIVRRQWQPGYTFGWILQNNAAKCKHPLSCTQKRMGYSHAFLKEGMMELSFDISLMLEALELCDACSKDGRTKMAEGRQKMWDSLPSFFKLPPWADLKNDL